MSATPETISKVAQGDKANGIFPFDTIREGQKAMLEDCADSFKEGGHLIAHAPTGIGKTAAVLTAALEYAIEKDKVVFFTTSKQSQHRIAIDTLKAMQQRSDTQIVVTDIVAKQDMCPRDFASEYYIVFNEFCKLEQKTKRCPYFISDNKAALGRLKEEIHHVQDLTQVCVSHMVCPHKTALDLGARSQVVVCDYNHLFTDISERTLAKINRDLDEIILIVDEAHNLPDRIRMQLSDSLNLTRLKEAFTEAKRFDTRLLHFLKGLSKLIQDMAAALNGRSEAPLEEADLVAPLEAILSSTLDKGYDTSKFIRALTTAGNKSIKSGASRSALLQVAAFLEGWSKYTTGYSRTISKGEPPRITYRLLDPSIITKEIFDGVHSSVLMSGTLYPQNMYSDLLGMGNERTLMRSYPSPFPDENKLVLVPRGITTRYTERGPAMYRKMANEIESLCQSVPGNIAVFFPSYALRDEVGVYIFDKKLDKKVLVEQKEMDKQEKENIIRDLIRFRKWNGALLMGVQGGSLSEGMDYADNLLEATVVVGLPLAPPSLEVDALKNYYNEKFGPGKGEEYGYIFPALNRVLQASGRCIRSERDRGIIILMDERFGQQRYSKYFPKEMGFEITSDLKKSYDGFF